MTPRFPFRASRDDASAGDPVGPLTRRRLVGAGALGLFGAVVLTACGQDGGEDSASGAASASATPTPTFTPKVTVTPQDGASEYNPTAPVTVVTDAGRVKAVEVTGGKAVEGTISEDGRTWTAKGPLEFAKDYRVQYTIANDDDVEHRGSAGFATTSAANEADLSFDFEDGGTYGTGQVIQLNFSEPVTDKAAVEKAVTVTGAGDQEGKFRWYSDQMVRYRPKDKWAPNSQVNVSIKLLGTDIGNGMIMNQNYERSFKTGPKNYAYVDNNTKTMKIYESDKLTKEFPVTLGDPQWPSVTGQLVVMEKAKSYFFDSRTLGLKPGDSHWYEPFYASNACRLTSSGAFVHQAEPSGYPYVGNTNISHGCIGLLPDGAEYFFNTFRVGDVVETVNTGYGEADPDNGYGDWNIPFEHYQDASWKGNW
ncbi:L,D-transpeptidase [Rothia kristinae]|uniref:L,D-TPase catalytic domain-containing protein n=1 Tax=Rothia kristinae TaxID=37923 RepID=A0A1S2N1D2_9MICC|nr:Ig-like domain-containing protein [Rothia kristinae]OIJ36250.1 hypothetical protein BK826_04180 [Rothia kristinae]